MPIALVALLALAAAEAPAPDSTPYDIEVAPHLVGSLSLLGVLGIYALSVRSEAKGGLTCDVEPGTTHCDPSRLNALDRTVVGNRSDAWLAASDVAAGVAMAAALVGTAVDAATSSSPERFHDFLTDATVVLEATAVATFVTALMKQAIRRPRPTQYSDAFTTTTSEHQLSFPSGHTATVSALAASYATTFALRHPDSPWRVAVIGGATGLVLLTGFGRVAGGFHFYSDVAAGMVLGGGIGFTLPMLLRRRDVAVVPVITDGGGGAAILATF